MPSIEENGENLAPDGGDAKRKSVGRLLEVTRAAILTCIGLTVFGPESLPEDGVMTFALLCSLLPRPD
jgi:hypothetical protein